MLKTDGRTLEKLLCLIKFIINIFLLDVQPKNLIFTRVFTQRYFNFFKDTQKTIAALKRMHQPLNGKQSKLRTSSLSLTTAHSVKGSGPLSIHVE